MSSRASSRRAFK
jgi:hypothetical protein